MTTISKSKRTANPKFTRNGKTRLKPLTLRQLEEAYKKATRPRDKHRIHNRIVYLKSVQRSTITS